MRLKFYQALFITLFLSINIAHGYEVLPAKNLFDAPIADPRWPKFLMGAAHDTRGYFGKSLWIFNFGENIGLVQFGEAKKPYEIGVQAGVFSFMDIGSEPTKLINTDYFVALGLSLNRDNWQYLFQFSHTSAHIGDEFLLTDAGRNINRINLSYEVFKTFIRYKPSPRYSPYAEFGYIFHIEPNYVKRFTIAAGIDYYSNKIIFQNSTRLIAGGFITAWEENNFHPTVTIRAGLQYERTKYCNRFLQLLLQYKIGKSQQGQFYSNNIQQFGIVVAFSS